AAREPRVKRADRGGSRLPSTGAGAAIMRAMTMSFGTVVLLLIVRLVIVVAGGMLGIGGGVLVIAALVVIFKQPHETAVGTSLAMLLPPIGIFAFLEYYRHGNVNVPMAALLAAGFAIGAYFGGRAVNS